MASLKKSGTTGHLLKNSSGHLIHTCGGSSDYCSGCGEPSGIVGTCNKTTSAMEATWAIPGYGDCGGDGGSYEAFGWSCVVTFAEEMHVYYSVEGEVGVVDTDPDEALGQDTSWLWAYRESSSGGARVEGTVEPGGTACGSQVLADTDDEVLAAGTYNFIIEAVSRRGTFFGVDSRSEWSQYAHIWWEPTA